MHCIFVDTLIFVSFKIPLQRWYIKKACIRQMKRLFSENQVIYCLNEIVSNPHSIKYQEVQKIKVACINILNQKRNTRYMVMYSL